jgi:AraC-like DNA-binding protein
MSDNRNRGNIVFAMDAVTSLFVRKMVAAAGPGVDGPALLQSVGLDPAGRTDPKAMVAAPVYYDLLERIAEKIDITELPLRTGASMRCDDYGALGLAFKAAPTLFGSYSRIARYARLWTSVVDYELQPNGENTWFILHRAGPRRLGLRLSNEATLVSATAIGREVSLHGAFSPLEVHLSHPAPSITTHHEAYFDCPVFFGSDRDAILISREAINSANKLGDEGITQFLLGHLDQELAQAGGTKPLKDRTKDTIARALSEGLPKMDDVARRLGMSVRSLHRRLADDGLTFQTLTEDTRRELAEGLLRDERYSIAEISFLTGFSEQSSFNRAFKRWGGDTPATYRKAQMKA